MGPLGKRDLQDEHGDLNVEVLIDPPEEGDLWVLKLRRKGTRDWPNETRVTIANVDTRAKPMHNESIDSLVRFPAKLRPGSYEIGLSWPGATAGEATKTARVLRIRIGEDMETSG